MVNSQKTLFNLKGSLTLLQNNIFWTQIVHKQSNVFNMNSI